MLLKSDIEGLRAIVWEKNCNGERNSMMDANLWNELDTQLERFWNYVCSGYLRAIFQDYVCKHLFRSIMAYYFVFITSFITVINVFL